MTVKALVINRPAEATNTSDSRHSHGRPTTTYRNGHGHQRVCVTLPDVAEDPNAQPTWKDLAEYTSKQAQNDRDIIDYWFKRAAWLLGIVLTFAAIVIGFVGWKTVGDAKATAETAAQEAAKAKVKEILQDARIQQLVSDTAKRLLAKGAFRQTTEEAVRAQLPEAVRAELSKQLPGTIAAELARRDLLPRTISAKVDAAFKPKLRPYGGKRILISFLAEPEPKAFAESLERSLTAFGIVVLKQESNRSVNQVITDDEGLSTALADLIGEATGRKPMTMTLNKAAPGGGSPRDMLAREFAASGNFITIPAADAYIEVGVRQAKR